MGYNPVPTITTGDVATASWGNTYIKDNFEFGVPDIFTTDGDMAVGTGANAAERVAVMNASNLLKHEVGGLEFDASAVTTNDAVGGASSGVMEIKTPVTQGEAQAGSGTRFSLWSPVRVAEAIAALAAKAVTREGGNTTEATSTSTSVIDLLTVGSLNIAANVPIMVLCNVRKTTGAAARTGHSLKLNATVISAPITGSDSTVNLFGTSSGANRTESGSGQLYVPMSVTSYTFPGAWGRSHVHSTGGTVQSGGFRVSDGGSRPTDPIDTMIANAISGSASITMGHDEMHVYSYGIS